MSIIEVDQETYDQIIGYNAVLKQWFTGIGWFNTPNLTENQLKKGEERLQLRLKQVSAFYDVLISKGIEVIPEEYIDIKRHILKIPF